MIATARRVRVLRIPARLVLAFLFDQKDLPHYVNLPVSVLPDGTKIVAGPRADRSGLYWEVLIEHPSFDEVGEMDDVPIHDGPFVEWHSYALDGPFVALESIVKADVTLRAAK